MEAGFEIQATEMDINTAVFIFFKLIIWIINLIPIALMVVIVIMHILIYHIPVVDYLTSFLQISIRTVCILKLICPLSSSI